MFVHSFLTQFIFALLLKIPSSDGRILEAVAEDENHPRLPPQGAENSNITRGHDPNWTKIRPASRIFEPALQHSQSAAQADLSGSHRLVNQNSHQKTENSQVNISNENKALNNFLKRGHLL